MAVFPSSPSLNQEFVAGITTYYWNGKGWKIKASVADSPWDTSGVVEPTTIMNMDGAFTSIGGTAVTVVPGATAGFSTVTNPFDASGSVARFNGDTTGGNNYGSPSGSPTTTTDAVSFSRPIESRLGDPLYLSGDFSIEGWVRPGNLTGGMAIGWGVGSTDELQGNDGGALPIIMGRVGGVSYIGTMHAGMEGYGSYAEVRNLDDSAIGVGDWFHFAFRRTSDVMSIYVNGVQEELYQAGIGTMTAISPAVTSISNPQVIDMNGYVLGQSGVPHAYQVWHFQGELAGFKIVDGAAGVSTIPTAYPSANAVIEGDLISDGVIALGLNAFDPMATADYTKLYTKPVVNSQPDILLNFNEALATDPITSYGRRGYKATPSNMGTPVDSPLGSHFGKSAVFNGTNSSVLTEDISGGGFASALRFEDGYTRGDFQIDVRFRIASAALAAEFVLLSSNVNSLPSSSDPAADISDKDIVVLIDKPNNKIKFKERDETDYAEFTWSPAADTDYALSINFQVDYNDFASTGSGSDPVVSGDGKMRIYVDGVPLEDAANPGTKYIAITDLSFMPEGSGGEVAAISLGKYLDGSHAAPKWFEGQMHEYVVFNNRCHHVGDESYRISSLPTRETTKKVLASIDSEGIGGVLLTTGGGAALPNHVEGLLSGSFWNDNGTVKIVP